MSKKIDYDFVRKFFEKHGCQLLESDYVCSTKKMRYICGCGVESAINWHDFKNGRRCKECGKEKANHKRRISPDYVKQYFVDQNCWLMDEYKNNYTPMLYRCSCGNVSKIRFFAFRNGQRCDHCDGGRGKSHYRWNPNREEILFHKQCRNRYGHLVRSVLKSLGMSKRFTSSKILGYSPKQLREHLKSFPDWQKISSGKWHIDHIFPIKAFLDFDVHDVQLINCLDNLQPLSAKANMKKNRHYSKEEFTIWLSKKGIIL
jgi:hypothetical protein